ncbi:hypothetical protein Tco_1076489, partial [Tanacetum coccineum]
ERRVVVQDQRLKSIIISCLPDDIMESVISYETAKATWTDLISMEENSNDEVDERSSEKNLIDLDIKFHERALLVNSKRHFAKDCFSKTSEPSYKSPVTGYSSVSKGFQPKFTPKLIQSSQNSISQADPRTPKTFQSKNKGLVAETFDWDEEEIFDDEEVTQVKVLMALADDEVTVGKNHARNSEWIIVTIGKVNILLSVDEDANRQNYLKYINIDLKLIEDQRLNLLSKYNKIVFKLNKWYQEPMDYSYDPGPFE